MSSLHCHECDDDAVGACRVCGKGFCGGHGADLCRGCATAIMVLEPGQAAGPRKQYLQCVSRPRMKTIHLDDDGPPECYRCQAYAKFICESCHNLYCPQHAGQGHWCEQCTRHAKSSSWTFLIVFAFLVGFMLLLGVLNWLQVW